MEQDRVQNLRDYFRIGLTYSSNAIKGNTLTESETKVVLENGTPKSGKLLKDHLDAIGHAKAFDYLWTLSRTSDKTEQDIKKLHELCFQPRTGDQAGSFLATNVLITGSAHNDELPGHEDIPHVMNRFVTELPEIKKSLHPVEYAAEIHHKLVMIHPFEDGNGRVARLLMNHALLRAGYPPVIVPPAFKHEYIQTLESGWNKPEAFVNYIAELELQAQREYIKLLRLPELEQQEK